MFFKIFVFMKKVRKTIIFQNKIATCPESCIKLHTKKLAKNSFFKGKLQI